MQWAPPKVRNVPRIFDRLVRLRQAHAWLMVLFCIELVAVVDLLSGPDRWLGPAYLLVICIAAWSLGGIGGQATGVVCMATTLTINGLKLYPYDNIEFIWNLVMRFGAISVIVAVIAGVRWAYVREWWLARSDMLTGALNRQAFFELAQTAISADRWRLLLYADLDGLKKVNDFQGHAAGDACLQAFGLAVRKMIRRGDIFARLGGDEFVIFMSVKDEASTKTVASRLHRAMNNVVIGTGTLNCSVGGLSVPPGTASLDELVLSADNLMYQGKLRGACLQFGTFSNVEPCASDRSRVFSRGARELARKGRADDRRSDTAARVDNPLLR